MARMGATPHFFRTRCAPARKDRMWGAMNGSDSILTCLLSFLFQRALIVAIGDLGSRRNRERESPAIAATTLTFENAARKVHEELKPSRKNEKHAAQWISTLETYVFPKLGNRKLDAISPGDCADVLRPIWLTKAETASRTRQPPSPSVQPESVSPSFSLPLNC